MAEVQLPFTDAELNAEMPKVVRAMNDYIEGFCVPIVKRHHDHGEAWGTGSFLRLGSRIFILTNEHVARARNEIRLLHQLHDQEGFLYPIFGESLSFGWPLDVALLPVNQELWERPGHLAKAITEDMIALTHAPVSQEFFTFIGFSGQYSGFSFGTLSTPGTSSTAREVKLPEGSCLKRRFHFGINYKPDSSYNVVGSRGLPRPHGFSGSTVWNTRFVESRMAGEAWTPECARVTGVVWGWPSAIGCIVATRSQYVRSFLRFASERRSRTMS
jgi:hypothetical protein